MSLKVLCLAPERTSSARYTATSVIDEEIDAIAAAGVEVHVLTPQITPGEPHGDVVMHGIPSGRGVNDVREFAFLLRQLPVIGIRSCALSARYCYYVTRFEHAAATVIRRERIDIIHSHFGFPGGLGGLLASRSTGRPLVSSFRGMDLAAEPKLSYGLRLSPFFDRAVRKLLTNADRTIYVSEFMRQEGIRLGAEPEKAITILKGVNLEKFSNGDGRALRDELGGTGPIVLIVSNLLPVKGVGDAIRALSQLKGSCEFTLVICGTGPQQSELDRLTREGGIQDRTHFVGKVDRERIADYFAAADVFVLPSVREASGNVLLEAAAAGTPIVCTDSGGPPEYVQDGVTGFIARPQDPPSLAEKLRLLLTSEELRTRMGSAALQHARLEFSYERMIREIVDVYNSLVGLQAPALRARYDPDER